MSDAASALRGARTRELEGLRRELLEARRAWERKDEAAGALEKEVELLRSRAGKAAEEQDALEHARVECARRLAEVREWAEGQVEALGREKEAEREAMARQLEELRAQNDRMLAEVRDPLRAEAQELQARRQELESANAALEARLSTLQADHAQKLMRLRSQLSDAIAEADWLRESIEAVRTRLRRTKRDSGSLLSRTARQQHSQQVAQHASLVTQAQDLEQQLRRTIQESDAHVRTASRELDEMRRACNAAEDERHRLEAEAEKVDSVNKEIDVILGKQQAELERLRRLIRTETNTRERLRLELERLDRVLSFSVQNNSPIVSEASRRISASMLDP